MASPWTSLIWKEWQERRLLFRSGLAIILIAIGYDIAYELEYETRTLVASCFQTCSTFTMFAAVLLAMSTAVGEKTQATLSYSASLPISLSRIAWVRLLGAWSCLVIPILCAAAITTFFLATGCIEQTGLRDPRVSLPQRDSLPSTEAIAFLWQSTAILVCSAIEIVTLLALLGLWCQREGTAGLVSAVVLLLWYLIIPDGNNPESVVTSQAQRMLLGGLFPQSLSANFGYGDIDGSNYGDLTIAPSLLGPLAMSCCVTLGLSLMFVHRYGRSIGSRPGNQSTGRVPRRAMRFPRLLPRLPINCSSPTASLLWLNARQSIPLSLAGLAISITITYFYQTDLATEAGLARRIANLLPENTWYVGMLWSALVAVAIYTPELQDDLGEFWRSRAISYRAWFWTKFAIGIMAVLGALDFLPLLGAYLLYDDKILEEVNLSLTSYVACIPMIHGQVFAITVAAICRLRRPIPAAIVGLLIPVTIDLVLDSVPYFPHLSSLEVMNLLDESGSVSLIQHGYPFVYGLMLCATLYATRYAHKAARSHFSLARVLTCVLLACSGIPSSLYAADTPTLTDIIAGMRTREAMIRDVSLHCTNDIHRTEFYYQLPYSGPLGGHQYPSREPRQEFHHYQYFEKQLRRAWSEFDDDNQILSTVAMDGQLNREIYFPSKSGRTREGRISAHNTREVPFLEPQNGLNSMVRIPMLEWLDPNTIELHSVKELAVNGSDGVELAFSKTTKASDSEPVRYNCTIVFDRSRHYWPVRIAIDIMTRGRIATRKVTEAHGWIDSAILPYPRHIEHRIMHAIARPTTAQDEASSRTDNPSQLETVVILKCDVQQVLVNEGIPDSAFAPNFPVGSIYSDAQDNKRYEIGADGEPHPYVPTPRGIRGAVFIYHLVWIAAVVAFIHHNRPDGN